ncbi:MAG: hypothetical protein AAFQ82_18935 [Myxococcota bacterium]
MIRYALALCAGLWLGTGCAGKEHIAQHAAPLPIPKAVAPDAPAHSNPVFGSKGLPE